MSQKKNKYRVVFKPKVEGKIAELSQLETIVKAKDAGTANRKAADKVAIKVNRRDLLQHYDISETILIL